MDLGQAKQKLIERYKYLYENAYFILAPFMYEEAQEKFKKNHNLKSSLIYLNINTSDKINSLFEEFLLTDKNTEDTTLYKIVENKRNDKEYLKQVKSGLSLLEKNNKEKYCHKIALDIWEILNSTGNYIEAQSSDLKNKEMKLKVLDEYYKIARYQNDGKIQTSGRKLNLHDCSSLVIPINKNENARDEKDTGIKENSFITKIANAPHYEYNNSVFTEGEKQKIYLNYHDELPCDLEIVCGIENDDHLTTEAKLNRPDNTSPCGKNFTIKEEEIFVNPNKTSYRYFQVCPHCGWIVNIPREFLSDGIKERIEKRCSQDEKLFKKMTLYSELFSLDKNSKQGQKKLLKKC